MVTHPIMPTVQAEAQRERASEARYGGRLITNYLSIPGIAQGLRDVIRRTPADLSRRWLLGLSPAGGTGSGRDSTAEVARGFAQSGTQPGHVIRAEAYLNPLLSLDRAEDMVSWPVYRAATGRRPVVVTATGEDTWEVVLPGVGEPELFQLDFDHEADEEWQRENLARYEAALEALRGRISPELERNFESGITDERERIALYFDEEEAE